MRVLGLTFAGTATEHREQMRAFVRETLGLTARTMPGAEADMFELPDGSTFAVASPRGMGNTERSIGFLVDDLDAALRELRAAGVAVDAQPAVNAAMRYAHFVAPDGKLYELVERRT